MSSQAQAALSVFRATVAGRRELARNIVRLDLKAPELVRAEPGQFVHVLCREPESWDPLLRRPMALADVNPDLGEAVLILQAAGRGTSWLARRRAGDQLDVMGPLGRGFPKPAPGERVLLVGGGTGVPPLYWLGRSLAREGMDVTAVMGFRSADRVILAEEMQGAGVRVVVATEDGSAGQRGTAAQVAESFWERADRVYACGPMGLLGALHRLQVASPRPHLAVSVETMMGCGVGACLSCVVPVRAESGEGGHEVRVTGWARACREGPVFSHDEIDWDRWGYGHPS